MNAERALDLHLDERDRHYQEWEDYYDALEQSELEEENVMPRPVERHQFKHEAEVRKLKLNRLRYPVKHVVRFHNPNPGKTPKCWGIFRRENER